MRFYLSIPTLCAFIVLGCCFAYSQDTGNLRVTITPSDAVNEGALWRRQGTETWFTSGETETGIPKGSYTVEFVPLSGWYSTPTESANIRKDNTTRVSVIYSPFPIPGPDFEGCRC